MNAPTLDRYEEIAAQAHEIEDYMLAAAMHCMIAAVMVGREQEFVAALVEFTHAMGKYETWIKTG